MEMTSHGARKDSVYRKIYSQSFGRLATLDRARSLSSVLTSAEGFARRIRRRARPTLRRASIRQLHESIPVTRHLRASIRHPAALPRPDAASWRTPHGRNRQARGAQPSSRARISASSHIAIRYAPCSRDPMAVIVRTADKINFCFMSESLEETDGLNWIGRDRDSPPPRGRSATSPPQRAFAAAQGEQLAFAAKSADESEATERTLLVPKRFNHMPCLWRVPSSRPRILLVIADHRENEPPCFKGDRGVHRPSL